jgi:hypothetical protein
MAKSSSRRASPSPRGRPLYTRAIGTPQRLALARQVHRGRMDEGAAPGAGRAQRVGDPARSLGGYWGIGGHVGSVGCRCWVLVGLVDNTQHYCTVLVQSRLRMTRRGVRRDGRFKLTREPHERPSVYGTRSADSLPAHLGGGAPVGGAQTVPPNPPPPAPVVAVRQAHRQRPGPGDRRS